MFARILTCVLLLTCFRFSKASAEPLLANTQVAPKPTGVRVVPDNLQPTTVVVDQCITVRDQITAETDRLVTSRNYQALAAMAERLRNDSRTFAQGSHPFDFY